ncbi:hypothetical protein ANN_18110 [Periplaneta americana]|uniref:Uncharacterized protein n=1 Tax=Periplaneta americana TaxID=6978 RepID=A0ABQ8SMT9_PERAM|nr:hypothetical protein ANN_18110 [Periplaneta americana]
MDLREVGCDDGRDWIGLAQDRDLCEGGNEPPGSLKASKVSVCVSLRVSVVSGMSDDEDEEGRRENPVPAHSLLLPNSIKGPPGLTFPSDGRITINNDICLLFICTAEKFGI